MKIAKVHIKGFGKLLDREMEFKPTFNVVYGDNASGKTTMSKFLLFSLSGFTKEEVDKYRPWNGNEFGGEIELLKDNGEGISLRFDPDSSGYKPPFKRIEFESMSYMPEEGGLDVTKGMEGTLLAKLKSRMVKLKSIEKLVELINNERDIFEKVSVKEKKIYEEIVFLQNELKELREKYEEEKKVRKRYVVALKRLKDIEREIERYEKLLVSAKAKMAKDLWKEIDNLRMEISNLGLRISELKRYSEIDESKIERIKELKNEIDKTRDEIKSLEKRQELRLSEIAKIKEHIKKLVKDLKIEENESPEAVELKIRNLELSLKLYKDKITPKDIPDSWKSFDSFEDVEKRITKIRNLATELKGLMEDEKKVEEEIKALEGEMKYARFKVHSRRILIGVFVALAAGLFGISFLTDFFLLLTVTASVSAGVALALWISMFDLKRTLSTIEDEKMKIELNKKVIQDKIKKVKSELSRQVSVFGFEDYEMLLDEYRLYKQWKSEWGSGLESEEIKKVEFELRTGLLEFYNNVSDDFEKLVGDLRDKMNLYMRLRERLGNLNVDVEEIKKRLEELNTALYGVELEYRELLKEVGCSEFEDCFDILNKKKEYYELLKEREILVEKLKDVKNRWEAYKDYKDLEVEVDDVELPEVIQERMENLKERKEELENTIEDLEELIKAKVVDINEYYKKVAKIQRLGIEHDFYLALIKVLPEIFEVFRKIKDEYIERYKNVFEERFFGYISRMFEENEVQFVVREDLGIEISLPPGKSGSLDSLSRATRDQIELAYKLALHDTMFPDETYPLIIDNTLVRYDERRLKETVELLKEIAEERQVLLFTSDRRLVSMMKSRNVIKL